MPLYHSHSPKKKSYQMFAVTRYFAIVLANSPTLYLAAVTLTQYNPAIPSQFRILAPIVPWQERPTLSLDFHLDRANPVALYQQISEHLKARISDGRLPAGAKLPTVR